MYTSHSFSVFLHGILIAVHHDVKPQNILLRRDDKEPFGIGVKITDFGLSKKTPLDGASVSADKRVTNGWTAPEILLKEKIVSMVLCLTKTRV